MAEAASVCLRRSGIFSENMARLRDCIARLSEEARVDLLNGENVKFHFLLSLLMEHVFAKTV